MTCWHHLSIKQSRFNSKKIIHALLIPPPLPLATTDFIISVISLFFFLECNVIVSMYFGTFYDWLLSFQ